MNKSSHASAETLAWQAALSDLITDPKELLALLELDANMLSPAYAASLSFPIKLTRSYAERIKKGDPDDPLLKQILPVGAELIDVPGFEFDPLQENQHNPVPGLLHKYANRVLVTLTGTCAIHCRYCFRRHFPYAENNPGRLGWEAIMTYIHHRPAIQEVILSGGDPLAASDHLLKLFSDRLKRISHVKYLRLHTRLPVVLPKRITPSFLDWISHLPFTPVVVIHSNHPNEINAEVTTALQTLREAKVTLLNQSVLLKGINDSAEILAELSKRLFAAGVLPYYLHILDKVKGTAHFDVAPAMARQIYKMLQSQLQGYLVPRLVQEKPGELSKTLF